MGVLDKQSALSLFGNQASSPADRANQMFSQAANTTAGMTKNIKPAEQGKTALGAASSAMSLGLTAASAASEGFLGATAMGMVPGIGLGAAALGIGLYLLS